MVYAEPHTEALRHELLQSQVFDKPRKAVHDCHMINQARLPGNIDIVHLRAERGAKNATKKAPKEIRGAKSGLSNAQPRGHRDGGLGEVRGGNGDGCLPN